MTSRRQSVRLRVGGLSLLVGGVGLFSAGLAAPAGASTPGVSGKTIKIGLVTSLTGPAAAAFTGALQGADARFKAQNAEGGVDGYKFQLIQGDDTSTPQGAQTAESELVNEKQVFGIIQISAVTGAAYHVPQQQNVPVIGFPADGPEWAQQPNTNMVAMIGDVGTEGGGAPYTYYAKVVQLAGATKVAGLAIANNEGSINVVTGFENAAKNLGMNVAYSNYNIPLGTVDVESVALAMKQAGVNGFYSGMLDTTDFALLTALKQAGVSIKAPASSTGYDQALLNEPASVEAGQQGIYQAYQIPVEEQTPAVKQEQAAFKKYEHFSGVPNNNWTYGYISADLYIKAIQKLGSKTLTRQSFLTALRSIKGYNADGLLASPDNFSLSDFGKAADNQCSYWVTLKGKAFVPLNNGHPLCGSLVQVAGVPVSTYQGG